MMIDLRTKKLVLASVASVTRCNWRYEAPCVAVPRWQVIVDTFLNTIRGKDAVSDMRLLMSQRYIIYVLLGECQGDFSDMQLGDGGGQEYPRNMYV